MYEIDKNEIIENGVTNSLIIKCHRISFISTEYHHFNLNLLNYKEKTRNIFKQISKFILLNEKAQLIFKWGENSGRLQRQKYGMLTNVNFLWKLLM